QYARQRQELALTAGKIAAAFAHRSMIGVGQLADEGVRISGTGRVFDALLGDRRIAQCQIRAYVAGEQKYVLQYHADMLAQRFQIPLADIDPAYFDRSLLNIIEPI